MIVSFEEESWYQDYDLGLQFTQKIWMKWISWMGNQVWSTGYQRPMS